MNMSAKFETPMYRSPGRENGKFMKSIVEMENVDVNGNFPSQ